MKHKEYLQKLNELKIEFKNKNLELMKDFVNSNNPYKIGDKITDHNGTILIEKIGYYWGFGNKPCATYSGVVLNKDGTPNKKGVRRYVNQNDII